MSVSKSFVLKTHITYLENTVGHYLEIKKLDKNGLISYYDKNENLIDQRAKYRFTYTATYTLVA